MLKLASPLTFPAHPAHQDQGPDRASLSVLSCLPRQVPGALWDTSHASRRSDHSWSLLGTAPAGSPLSLRTPALAGENQVLSDASSREMPDPSPSPGPSSLLFSLFSGSFHGPPLWWGEALPSPRTPPPPASLNALLPLPPLPAQPCHLNIRLVISQTVVFSDSNSNTNPNRGVGTKSFGVSLKTKMKPRKSYPTSKTTRSDISYLIFT